MLGGGAEKEGKVFMRGDAEGEAKLETSIDKVFVADLGSWVTDEWC